MVLVPILSILMVLVPITHGTSTYTHGTSILILMIRLFAPCSLDITSSLLMYYVIKVF